MKEVMSFIEEFVRRAQGDDAKADAIKAKRKGTAGLKTQISIMEGETVNLEENLETAKEVLQGALLNNGKPIDKADAYVKNLIDSKNVVTEAQAELDNHEETLQFLKDSLSKIESGDK